MCILCEPYQPDPWYDRPEVPPQTHEEAEK